MPAEEQCHVRCDVIALAWMEIAALVLTAADITLSQMPQVVDAARCCARLFAPPSAALLVIPGLAPAKDWCNSRSEGPAGHQHQQGQAADWERRGGVTGHASAAYMH